MPDLDDDLDDDPADDLDEVSLDLTAHVFADLLSSCYQDIFARAGFGLQPVSPIRDVEAESSFMAQHERRSYLVTVAEIAPGDPRFDQYFVEG